MVLRAGFLRLPAPSLWISDERAHFALLELRDLLDAKVTFLPAEFAPELLRRLLRERFAERADRGGGGE